MTVTAWRKKPFIYEINTWVWLSTLSQQYERKLTLADVPDEVLDELASYHFDAVWLMGIWERSPRARQQAHRYAHEYQPALPDLQPEDIIGSAYAIYNYTVDPALGGREALAVLRQRLKDRGMRLILDYVPNHVALDHPWVAEHPGYFMQGTPTDLERRPSDFFAAQDAWGREMVIAHGRDPYFPGWNDTAQLNAFSPHLREAVKALTLDIASQCDGVRCDMAMLFVNHIFAQTWYGHYTESEMPTVEFWEEIIPNIKSQHPDFLFMAEVYWNMEYDLQNLGFDLTYDKRLYDRFVSHHPRDIRVHLLADIHYQSRLVRFTENHDEPRAYATFGPEKSRAVAALACTLPGATLLYDGQFTGRKVKLPVQIGRQPVEPTDQGLVDFYQRLLNECNNSIYQDGKWRLFKPFPAWANNPTYDNIVSHGWASPEGEYRLIVVNMGDTHAQALINLSAWHDIPTQRWRLYDVISSRSYVREGAHLTQPGLYIDLPPYGVHLFRIQRL